MTIIIDEIKKIYSELKLYDNDLDHKKCGRFPEEFIITQFASFDDKSQSIDWRSKQLKQWSFVNGEISEVCDLIFSTSGISGMYYKVGTFWIYNDNESCVIEFQIGPRYGRGYMYDLSEDKNKLLNQKLLWVS